MAGGVIDSKRLLVFLRVAETGSLSKAEGSLFIAQSAISRHISKLEEDLGVQLLERHGRGVTLTPFGEILYRQGEGILTQMTSVMSEIEDAKRQPAGRVRVSASAVVMSLFMPEIVSEMMAKHPEVEITALHVASGEVYNSLVTGKVDVAIVMRIPNKAKYHFRKLLEEPMVLIASRSDPIAEKRSIQRFELANLPLVLPASPHGLRGLIDDYVRSGGVTVFPRLQADSVPLIRKIIADGNLFAVMPQSSYQEDFGENDFVGLPIQPMFTRTLYAASRKDETGTPYLASFLDIASKIFDQKSEMLVSAKTPPLEGVRRPDR